MTDLTICVPTRNRQRYCIETVKALAQNEGRDFEVVVADNSDDPSILSDFFANDFHDDRFRLLPPGERVYSMVDNWERTIPETAGRWVVVIGDDDYIDPRVTGLLKHFEKLYKGVEAIGWNRMNFNWPDNRSRATLATVPCTFKVAVARKSSDQDRLFRWTEKQRRPAAGFGIYHGAVKRSLMDRIKRKYGNRYFEHPNVDYESSCKVIAEAKVMVHCQRGFSVLGACASSNSAGTQSRKAMQERTNQFLQETRDNIPTEHPDFPFPLSSEVLSICVGVAHTTFWFCKTYGIDLTGFPENFAGSAMKECANALTEEEYDLKVSSFRKSFAAWDDGKWASHFNPAPYAPGERILNELSGVVGEVLYLSESKLKAKTPAEFYRFAEHAMLPVELVVAGARTFAR